MIAIFILALTLFGRSATAGSLDFLQVPEGFLIQEFAQVPNARALALGEQGTIFVSTRTDGRIFALRDQDGDGRADKRWVLLEDLNLPTGIAFHQGALFVAESGAIWRLDAIENRLAEPPEPQLVVKIPSYRHHGWRDIGFGPDDRLYVAMGAPCNVCEPGEFGSIWRFNVDGTGQEIYAKGVRNSVGLAWHPETGELWFTDNGRDWLGDDLPPDELNRATQIGQHFGFPFCHGGKYPDAEFTHLGQCNEATPPVQNLGPHVAALGLIFYTGEQFPREYQQQILLAEHGSWNRSTKIGYQISLVRLANKRAIAYEPFVSGWLDGENVLGRPVDLLQLADGSVLISDDAAGRIVRLTYGKN